MATAGAGDASASTALEPAGIPRRIAALVYDTLLITALAFAVAFLAVLARGGAIAPGSPWFGIATYAIVGGAFYGSFWTRSGQTLGMQAWRIRVVAASGERIGWRHAVVRCAAALLAAAPLGAGYWWAWLDPERRTWHDRLSGTRTIRVR